MIGVALGHQHHVSNLLVYKTYICETVSGSLVNKTKSIDIFESARLVMMTSVELAGSSPVRYQSSSYGIGHGDCYMSTSTSKIRDIREDGPTVRFIFDSATLPFREMVADP